ncbi:MAG: ferrous iron transport protein B, partial [Clostridia bacterium]|nr:ferrous iron transport protein B [Clostridia bacterium]
KIDVRALEKRIGLPVVEISALKGDNIDTLMKRALESVAVKRQGESVLRHSVLGSAIANAEIALKLKEVTAPLFHAVKLVEKDEIEVQNHPAEARAVQAFISENVTKQDGFDGDAEAAIADARYKYITEHFSSTLTRARKHSYEDLSKSDKADKVLTNKWAGIPIFLVILFAIFHLTFSDNLFYLGAIPAFGEWCGTMAESTVGAIFFGTGINTPGVILFNAMDLLTASIGEWLALGLGGLKASEAVIGFICDGVWGGVAGVLSFLPQILVLFLFFSILEDSGYMARVAFMLDRIFRRFGVSGRAFMPMIMGFGCSVPAMINTRTMADEQERTATVRVIPFFSCGAKMPILLAIAGAIAALPGSNLNADIVTYSMYLLGIVTALIALLIMRNTSMRGEASPFIMELPIYHMPGFKNLMLHLWDKAKHFIQKAFTIIVASCIIIWFLSNFGWDWRFVGEDMDTSILASLGKLIQPLFTPLGFGSQLNSNGWVFAVAAITGLIAKEDVIATFGTLAACIAANFAGATEDGVYEVGVMIAETGITVPALISFIAFNMLTIPCFAAVAAAKGEIGKGKFKWTLLFWIVTSYFVSSIVYTVGEFVWPLAVWLLIAVLATIGIVWYNRKADQKQQPLYKK